MKKGIICLMLWSIGFAGGSELNCLDCHDNVTQKSVHDGAVDCQGCHQDVIDTNHSKTGAQKVRCETCHKKNNDLVKSDIHHRINVTNPPTCKACHGTHQITKAPRSNPAKVKEYCSKCHDTIVLANPYHSKVTSGKACLQCHKDTSRANVLAHSVHKGLQCADCHNFISNNLANHPENVKVMQKADCYLCHSKIAEQHRESIHGISLREGVDEAAMCWNCHGSHDIRKVKDPTSSVHPSHLAATCGSCHDNVELMKKYNVAIPEPGRRYPHSVHGKLAAKGRTDAPSCSGCHGIHDIRTRFNQDRDLDCQYSLALRPMS